MRHTPKDWLVKLGEGDINDERLWLIFRCQRLQVGVTFPLAYDQGVEALEGPDLQFLPTLLQHVGDLKS